MNSSLTYPTRRRFIALCGGGVVVAAAPLTGCSSSYPSKAVHPWQAAAGESDLRRFMLAHGLLAPNPHNRQPWLADLSQPDAISLVCDADRLLPHTDPYGRQILIGCGAFIELARMAAAERGHAVTVQVFPNGEPAADRLPGGAVVARLQIGPSGSVPSDPLFQQVTRRHTNKGSYDPSRSVPPALAQQWQALIAGAGLQGGLVAQAATVAALRQATRLAWEQEILTPRTWLESAHLLRIGPDAIAQHRDGISIMGALPRLLHAAGLFDPLEVPTPGSSNFKRVMERWAPFETGSGFLWIASKGNSRVSQVKVGQVYVRAHLVATAAGVDMHPLSQALQEFVEVSGPRQGAHDALGLDMSTSTLQMLARVGYGTKAAQATPRRDALALIRRA